MCTQTCEMNKKSERSFCTCRGKNKVNTLFCSMHKIAITNNFGRTHTTSRRGLGLVEENNR